MTLFGLEFWILPVVAVLGLMTSYTDVRWGLIRNRTLVQGLVIGLVWNAALAYLYSAGDALGIHLRLYPTHWPYAVILVVNGALAFFIGYVLWWFDLWSPGDAKLYALYAFLIPPGIYRSPAVGFFPAYELLTNGFIFIFALVFVEFVGQTVREGIGSATSGKGATSFFTWLKKEGWELVKVGGAYVLLLVAILQIRMFLREELQQFFSLNNFALYLLLFVLFEPLHHLVTRRWVVLLIGTGLAGWVGYNIYRIATDPEYTWGAFSRHFFHISGLMLFIIGFRVIYDLLSPRFNSRPVAPEDLEPKQILTSRCVELISHNDVFREKWGPYIGPLHKAPLTEKIITDLREWHEHNPVCTFEVEKHLPFAPSLLLGVLLTFWLRGMPHLPIF